MTRVTTCARWIRVIAVATAALVLASCRSLSVPVATLGTAVTVLPDDVVATGDETAGSPLLALLADPPTGMPLDPAAGSALSTADPAVLLGVSRDESRRHEGVVPAGLEAPCPPLPRLGPAAGLANRFATGRCGPGPCGPACRVRQAACPPAGCPPQAMCVSCEQAIPVVGPYLVCDGGDHGALAQAVGEAGLANLSAGDTVARFRPADDGPDADRVEVVASNCACVYAPRFGAVREVSRPLEDAAPVGPGGLATDQLVELEVERQPVWGSVQNLAPGAARKALPGVALRERLAPLAVDQGDLPLEEDGAEGPNEQLAIDQLEQARRRQRPHAVIGFDVPVAWTSIKAANVLVNEKSAQVVAADRGTATLRFEEPGRAELTLCKRAGTDTARVGEEIDFTIVMLNSGDRPLTGIVLADALPKRLELVPDSAASSLPATFSTETGDDGSVVLTWRLTEPLPAGASGFVRFRSLVR